MRSYAPTIVTPPPEYKFIDLTEGDTFYYSEDLYQKIPEVSLNKMKKVCNCVRWGTGILYFLGPLAVVRPVRVTVLKEDHEKF